MNKIEKFEAIVEVLESAGADAELIECIEKERESAINKAAKAKERQAAKKEAGDELRGVIKNILTDEPMTLDEIVEAIGEEGVTVGKVRTRVSQLVDLEQANKEQIVVEYETEDGKTKKKKVMAYTIA